MPRTVVLHHQRPCSGGLLIREKGSPKISSSVDLGRSAQADLIASIHDYCVGTVGMNEINDEVSLAVMSKPEVQSQVENGTGCGKTESR